MNDRRQHNTLAHVRAVCKMIDPDCEVEELIELHAIRIRPSHQWPYLREALARAAFLDSPVGILILIVREEDDRVIANMRADGSFDISMEPNERRRSWLRRIWELCR